MNQALTNAATRRLAMSAMALGGAAFLAQSAMYNVDAGHRAIIISKLSGVKEKPRAEGTHFLLPIIERPVIFDVRTRPRTIHSVTGTKDLQAVNISLRILSRPDPSYLTAIYRQLGIKYDERVLPSIANEVLKSIVAQYNADELLMRREKISRQIADNLRERATDFNIVLDDISITHLAFSDEFAKAIEAKQVAEQIAEKAKFVVHRAEQERQAAVIEAEGESEAARVISEALVASGTGLIQLRKIEAAKDIAATLGHGENVTYLPGGNNMLLNVRP